MTFFEPLSWRGIDKAVAEKGVGARVGNRSVRCIEVSTFVACKGVIAAGIFVNGNVAACRKRGLDVPLCLPRDLQALGTVISLDKPGW